MYVSYTYIQIYMDINIEELTRHGPRHNVWWRWARRSKADGPEGALSLCIYDILYTLQGVTAASSGTHTHTLVREAGV